MLCPNCQSPLQEGRIELRSPRLWPASRVDDASLCFTDAAGNAIYPEVGHRGFRCRECDTVVVLGRPDAELTCFECGTLIVGDAERCPDCGWSWK
ncbi:MAG: hypothetical protein HS104_19735 [Polyangiaceae bacterium]|nr:hypothetical protein [Polyangiaceae bacterium]MCL4755595.1 hypothetical protein [Myxococcales bacterium]